MCNRVHTHVCVDDADTQAGAVRGLWSGQLLAVTFPGSFSFFVLVSVVKFGLCCLHLAMDVVTKSKHFHKNKENAEMSFYREFLHIIFQLYL